MSNKYIGATALGVGILAGMILAVHTLLPSMTTLNDALSCVTAECSDLQAQRSMAFAAWAMAAITLIGAIVGAVSLGLIFWTLDAARRSAVAAEFASAEAAKSVSLARKALKATRRYGLAQTRSYVTVKQVSGEYDDGRLTLALMVKNSGATPAHTVRIDPIIIVSTPATEEQAAANIPFSPGPYFLADIAAGDDEPVTIGWSIKLEAQRGLTPAQVEAVELTGHIKYFDIYGDPHPYEFGFRGRPGINYRLGEKWYMHRLPIPLAESKPPL